MLLFRSAEEVQAWRQATGRPGGAIVALAQLRRLAAAWYGGRLDPGWRPRTSQESQAVLELAGLTGEFWRLPE
jgi:hypothetical protein